MHVTEVNIILWGVKTTTFSVEYRFHRWKNVVVIVTGLFQKEKYGAHATRLITSL